MKNKIEKRGLSYARNLGIKNALADKLLFLDADALPSDTWAAHMAAALEETVNTPKPTYVAAVSGNIAPLFLPKSGIPSATVRKSNNTGPAWCKSKLVLEMYSALQFPVKRMLLGRMIGASCGVNLKRVGRELEFDKSLGRNNNLRGGEETKYASTIEDAGFAVIYCGEAKVRHCIPYERQNLKWLFKRTYSQGLDREKKKGMPKPFNDKMSFHDYLWLPFLGIAFSSGWLSSKFS